MPKSLHILYEHAVGYTLFVVKEFEEIGLLQPEVEKSVLDLSRFNSIVSLVAFSPFKSGANALDNALSISEGVMHPDLRAFLEANLPAASPEMSEKKKKKAILGVFDSRLSTSINAELGLNCMHTGVVAEILRGLRFHGPHMIKGMTEVSQDKAQLGLGHAYSRSKVKFNAHRSDNMIIQSINLLDQQDKNINTFVMRLKEWYGYHFPELSKLVADNTQYAKCAIILGNRKNLDDSMLPKLEEALMDSAKAEAIIEAAKTSMGMEISEMDMVQAGMFAKQIVAMMSNRETQQEYLREKMDLVAPNVSALVGEQLGARLIAHAGSLTNLAKYPASTVQILGAEKALFRALKTRGNTPKYGHIFKSTFIGRAGAKNKGRISRNLANKCSIASRIDCFSENPNKIFGETLKEQVEERLKFYESGDIPRKNIDVMKLAVEKAKEDVAKSAKKLKKKKRKASEMNESTVDETVVVEADDNDVEMKSEKKKKKKKKATVDDDEVVKEVKDDVEAASVEKKKKKKKKSIATEE